VPDRGTHLRGPARERRRVAGQTCPAHLRRWAAPDGPGVVCRAPPGVGAGAPGQERGRVHPRADTGAVRFISRHGRPGDRRQPVEHRHLLRRQSEHRAVAGRHHELPGRRAGRRGDVLRAGRPCPRSIDSGAGLSGLPGTILKLTGNATSLIDPAQLPVDPATCKPVYPHQYIKFNTVFEVARAAGLRTAWSDKHAAYEVLNGPSGAGIQDLFTPEINSDAPTLGSSIDWTKDNALTISTTATRSRRSSTRSTDSSTAAQTASGRPRSSA